MIFVRTLDRYVMREFLRILVLALLSLTAVFVLIHMMDHVDLYIDSGASWLTIGRYYIYQTPYNLLITMPMAMMVATILSIGDLGRHGELTAMKASGVSLYRIIIPVIVFSFAISLVGLYLGETSIPGLNEHANEIYDQEILGDGPLRENYRGNFVYQNSDGYTYLVRSMFVEESGATAEQVEVQRRFDDGTFLRINAPNMMWEDESQTWILRDGEYRLFPGGEGERMYKFLILRSADLRDNPEELLVKDREPEEMGYADLEAYILKRERLGAETRTERVDLQMKVAYPFANLIIVIFAVALVGSAAHLGRRGGTVGFGLALFLTIVFWGFLRVGQGIGYGGGLPPVAAAWLANGIFLVVGLLLTLRAKT